MRWRALLIALAMLALTTHAAAAAAPEALARDALAAYAAAQAEPGRDRRTAGFARAEELFAQLASAMSASPSAALQVNLGNAALQAQHLGVAVLSYKRALAIDPSHGQAARNLQHARTLLPSWVPQPAPTGATDSVFFWHTQLPRATRTRGAALAFAAAGALLGTGLYTRRRGVRGAAIVPGLIWLALVASLAIESRGEAGEEAVLLAEEAVARSSDSAFAPSALAEPLPAGTELRIVEERGGWLQVRLANGRPVWLRASGVGRVASPDPGAGARSEENAEAS